MHPKMARNGCQTGNALNQFTKAQISNHQNHEWVWVTWKTSNGTISAERLIDNKNGEKRQGSLETNEEKENTGQEGVVFKHERISLRSRSSNFQLRHTFRWCLQLHMIHTRYLFGLPPMRQPTSLRLHLRAHLGWEAPDFLRMCLFPRYRPMRLSNIQTFIKRILDRRSAVYKKIVCEWTGKCKLKGQFYQAKGPISFSTTRPSAMAQWTWEKVMGAKNNAKVLKDIIIC